MDINLEKIKSVHFIGIGGIGISALARMMLGRGKKVSGSDVNESRITNELTNLGAHILTGHVKENIPSDTELVVYTIAVSENNPEIVEARERGLFLFSYPEFLGLISENMFTIAVSGTHGKTTTTAMISDVLWNEGINPTVIVGSLLKNGGTNFIEGDSPTHVWDTEYEEGFFLVEACEYRRSFLNLHPRILIINNIDDDHLDYYRNTDDIISAFRSLAELVPKDGVIIADLSDKNTVRALKGIRAQIVDYKTVETPTFNLLIPGGHNRRNAMVAYALASVLRIDLVKAEESLNAFSGTWRRFEYKGKTKNGALVYDDYAHHPKEIEATLAGFRERFPNKILTVVFQPHLYSRTKTLFEGFVLALARADRIIITDIYSAREKNDPSISGKLLAEKITEKNKNTLFLSDFKEIVKELLASTDEKDVLVTMGAGDIYKVGESLVSQSS